MVGLTDILIYADWSYGGMKGIKEPPHRLLFLYYKHCWNKSKIKKSIKYPNLPSDIWPIPPSDEPSIASPPENLSLPSENSSDYYLQLTLEKTILKTQVLAERLRNLIESVSRNLVI